MRNPSQNRGRLLALTALSLSACLARAGLDNASFEDPVQTAGNFSTSGVPGWSGGTGVWYIPTNSFFLANAPDGKQIAYSNATFMSQQSGNAVGLGVNTVTVMAGRRHDSFAGSFVMKLWAGGTVNTNGSVTGGTLLTSTSFDYTTIPPDSFTLLTATYTANPGDPLIGQFITVQFEKTVGSQMNLDDVRISSPGSESVAPASVTVNLGRVTSGGVSAFARQDAETISLCKFFVPNQTSPFVQFTLEGNSALTTQTNLRFRTRSRTMQAGAFTQTVRLFNFVTNAYEQQKTDTINTLFQSLDLVATGAVNRYVGAGGAVRTQIQCRQTGPSAATLPCVEFDQAAWDIVQ